MAGGLLVLILVAVGLAVYLKHEAKMRVMAKEIALMDAYGTQSLRVGELRVIKVADGGDMPGPLYAFSVTVRNEGSKRIHALHLKYVGPDNWECLPANDYAQWPDSLLHSVSLMAENTRWRRGFSRYIEPGDSVLVGGAYTVCERDSEGHSTAALAVAPEAFHLRRVYCYLLMAPQ
jgi:hypothetical protein